MSDAIYHAVGPAEKFGPGTVTHLEILDREIGLYQIDGEFFAIDDICTHMRARLSDGYVKDDVIECPLHFGRFDIATGKAVSAPCKIDLDAYPVRVVEGIVEVGITALGNPSPA